MTEVLYYAHVANWNNPHKLASPFEILYRGYKASSYHLDKNYTPFGKVIFKEMSVVRPELAFNP